MIDIKNCFTYAYSAGTFADFYQNINTDEVSTNVIDLWGITTLTSGESGVRISGSKGPYIIMKSVAAGSGTGTINVKLVNSTSTTMSGGNIIQQWYFADTVMTAGKLLVNQQLPCGIYYRYLGLYFDIFTTTCAGFLAYLTEAPETAVLLPAQTTISS